MVPGDTLKSNLNNNSLAFVHFECGLSAVLSEKKNNNNHSLRDMKSKGMQILQIVSQ